MHSEYLRFSLHLSVEGWMAIQRLFVRLGKKSVEWPNGNSVTNRLFLNLTNGNLVTNSRWITIRPFKLKRKRNLRYLKFTCKRTLTCNVSVYCSGWGDDDGQPDGTRSTVHPVHARPTDRRGGSRWVRGSNSSFTSVESDRKRNFSSAMG